VSNSKTKIHGPLRLLLKGFVWP